MPYSDKQRKTASTKTHATHQDRVNQQIFHAMELLGRRLERTEVERNRIAKRINHLESCAKHDPKTGRYYLPVETTTPPQKLIESKTPKWVMGGTMLSTGLAIAAMVMILSAEPALTPSQKRVLNSPQFASLMSLQLDKQWRVVEVDTNLTNANPNYDLVAMAKRLDALKAEEEAQAAAEKRADQEIIAELSIPERQQQIAEIAAETAEQRQEEMIAAAATVKAVDLAKTEPAAGAEMAKAKVAPLSPAQNKIVIEQDEPLGKAQPKITAKAKREMAPGQEHVGKSKSVSPAPAPKTLVKNDVNARQAVEHVSTKPKKTDAPVETSAVAQEHVTQNTAQKQAQRPVTSNKKVPTRTVFQTAAAGIVQDLEMDTQLPERFQILEKRAIEGIPEAQHDLATLYAAGDVVQRDFTRAAYWFKQAADNGIANAHYNLGVIYHQGLGVRTDVQEALGWYHNAAELGHPEALYNLGIAYVEGIGTDMDIERGASYFKRAAHAGVAQAAFNLAVLYESSFMGGADTKTALEWYELSANLGHNDGYQAVKRLKGLDDAEVPVTIAENIEQGLGTEHMASQRLVAIIQEKLVGYHMLPTGSVNGMMDAKTEDAIRAYQRQAGLNIDGQVSKSLLKHMVAP